MNQQTPVDVALTRYVAEFVVDAKYEDLSAEVVELGKTHLLAG